MLVTACTIPYRVHTMHGWYRLRAPSGSQNHTYVVYINVFFYWIDADEGSNRNIHYSCSEIIWRPIYVSSCTCVINVCNFFDIMFFPLHPSPGVLSWRCTRSILFFLLICSIDVQKFVHTRIHTHTHVERRQIFYHFTVRTWYCYLKCSVRDVSSSLFCAVCTITSSFSIVEFRGNIAFIIIVWTCSVKLALNADYVIVAMATIAAAYRIKTKRK